MSTCTSPSGHRQPGACPRTVLSCHSLHGASTDLACEPARTGCRRRRRRGSAAELGAAPPGAPRARAPAARCDRAWSGAAAHTRQTWRRAGAEECGAAHMRQTWRRAGAEECAAAHTRQTWRRAGAEECGAAHTRDRERAVRVGGGGRHVGRRRGRLRARGHGPAQRRGVPAHARGAREPCRTLPAATASPGAARTGPARAAGGHAGLSPARSASPCRQQAACTKGWMTAMTLPRLVRWLRRGGGDAACPDCKALRQAGCIPSKLGCALSYHTAIWHVARAVGTCSVEVHLISAIF